jgi:hypothetical protein
MEKIDKEEFELMKSNSFWAGRLIDLPKEKSWEIADEIVAAIQYAESQVKNHGVSHHVSKLYTIEQVEKCIEHWGMCKVEKEHIERFCSAC